MAENAADTEREIGRLRTDASAAVAELQRRLSGGVREVIGTDARVGGMRAGAGVAQTVREDPTARGALVASVAVAVGVAALATARRMRERRRLADRLRDRARLARDEIEERLESTRRLADETRRRGVLLRVKDEGPGYMRVTGARLDMPKTQERKKTDVLKNLLWAALLALLMAFAGVVARRVAGVVWHASFGEEPPTEKK